MGSSPVSIHCSDRAYVYAASRPTRIESGHELQSAGRYQCPSGQLRTLEWVDHAYPFGVITLNRTYTGSIIDQGLLDPLDSERLARLHIYGEPAAIPEWDGWRNPTIDEVQELHDIMDQEDYCASRQGT
jgi:hypothetical protein